MEQSIENALRELPRIGTRVKDRGYRQVWRFERAGKAYFLKFYPRRSPWARLARGNPAMREMLRLQWLQKAQIPAPRAVGVLVGFVLEGKKGDAVLTEAIEPAVSLESALADADAAGGRVQEHWSWMTQTLGLLQRMARHGLGHDDLHLGNLLLKDGRVHLIDAYAVRRGGLRMRQLLLLEHSARPWLTRADRVRAWLALAPGRPMPRQNPVSRRQWRKFLRRSGGDNRYFGHLPTEQGRAVYMRRFPRPQRWSWLSRQTFDDASMGAIWAQLHRQRNAGELAPVDGNAWNAQAVVDAKAVPLLLERRADAQRLWRGAWHLIVRGIATSWPLARAGPWVVRERVLGTRLSELELDELDPQARQTLFRRLGYLARQLYETGLHHPSLSGESFAVMDDPKLGPVPVLVDAAPIRPRRGERWSLPGLLAALKSHRQYAPEDSLAVCRGYAPYVTPRQEGTP